MPFPRWVARVNKRFTNHVLGPLFRRIRPGAIVVHVGRRSGRRYETPVAAFPADDGYVLALTYGPDADWVRNVLAAGGAELIRAGRPEPVHDPRVVGAEVGAPRVPWLARVVLRIARSRDFLLLRRGADGGGLDSGP